MIVYDKRPDVNGKEKVSVLDALTQLATRLVSFRRTDRRLRPVTPRADHSDGDHHAEVIQAEVAMELINRARGLVYERIYRLEKGGAADQRAAKKLDAVVVKLYELLRTIDYREPKRVRAVIAQWSPLMRDEEQFWTVLKEGPGLFNV